jgi:hypothetical protein
MRSCHIDMADIIILGSARCYLPAKLELCSSHVLVLAPDLFCIHSTVQPLE